MKDAESLLFLKGALTSLRDILLGDWKSEGMSSRLSSVFVGGNRFLWRMRARSGGKMDGMESEELIANRVRKIMTVKK